MKTTFLAAVCILAIACGNKQTSKNNNFVQADSLTNKVENYIGRKIITEGTILHVCPVNGLKMKLRTPAGAIIKVEAGTAFASFDQTLNKKQLRIEGTIREQRLSRAYIDSIATYEILTCHIDDTPCIDSTWVANVKAKGRAPQVSQATFDALKAEMEKTGKDYVSVTVLIAEKIEEIQIVSEEEQIKTTANTTPLGKQGCGNCALCGLCTRKA